MTAKESAYDIQLRKLRQTADKAYIEYQVLKRTLYLEEPENPQVRADILMQRLRNQCIGLVSDISAIVSELEKIKFS